MPKAKSKSCYYCDEPSKYEIDDRNFCQEHHDEFVGSCDDCDAEHMDSNLHDVHYGKGLKQEKVVCNDCISEYTECSDCGQTVPDRNITDIDDDTHICDNCLDHWVRCQDCSRWIKRGEDTNEVRGGGVVCDSCREDKYFYCDKCEETVPADEFDTERDMCNACAEDYPESEEDSDEDSEDDSETESEDESEEDSDSVKEDTEYVMNPTLNMTQEVTMSDELKFIEPVNGNGNAQDYLEKLSAALRRDASVGSLILQQGTQIVIPTHMNLISAAQTLVEYHKAQEEEIQVRADFEDSHPDDAAVNFVRAAEDIFGKLMETASFSFFGVTPGRKIDVRVSTSETIKIPFGDSEIPGAGIKIHLAYSRDDSHPSGGEFGVIFTCKRRFEPVVNRIIESARARLKTHSIFKGHAIDSKYRFQDFSGVNPANIIYNAQTEAELNAHVFGVVRYSTAYAQNNLPLNSKILLVGDYGTGKTETARLLGKYAEDNGWTFIIVKEGDSLVNAIAFARKHQPAVVFAEDIDEQTDGERDGAMNKILNQVDSILGKEDRVMMVFTTNHPERLSSPMRRPGRSRTIQLLPFDNAAIIKLVMLRLNATTEKYTADEFNWEEICIAAKDYTPTFISTAVSEAVAYNLTRHGGNATRLETQDLVEALNGLRPQFDYMKGKQEITPPTLDSAMGDLVQPMVKGLLEPIEKTVTEIKQRIG